MKRINLLLHLIFTVIVVVVLFQPHEDNGILRSIFKPLIMAWVACYFVVNLSEKGHPVVIPALLAFFFSWIGDIALLFHGNLFFLCGLGAFLVSHLFYISLFQNTEDRKSASLIRKNPWWIIPFIAYGLILIWILFPGASNSMKPAIFIYAVAILTMAASALNRMGRVPSASFLAVMTGAVLFVTSDTLIAVNKFVGDLPNAGSWVMPTYILAQYLIMRGLLIQVCQSSKSQDKL